MKTLELENGKYKLVLNQDYSLDAYRYGQHWQNLTGDKLIFSMWDKIETLQNNNTIESTFSKLLDVLPTDTVVFKTMSYEVSALQMLHEIENGSDLGKRYMDEVLTVARDFVLRQSKRNKNEI